jgi:glyoxylase-like metal-dependent hydrolase (beta-lactamase superfamily II)
MSSSARADSWDVTSTLIYGKSEAILVDSQFRISQAKKLADQVAARGRRLKAIIITHPDNDHCIGTASADERRVRVAQKQIGSFLLERFREGQNRLG